MTPKEINRESGRIFENILLPSWAARNQEDQEDYGVDFEIEVTTPNDHATGLIFKVQLKGSEQAKYDHSGNLTYSGLSVDRLDYYLNRLKIPLIFVVCDVETQRCYWQRIQGNRVVESVYRNARDRGQKSLTLKFSKENQIFKNEETGTRILQAVEDSVNAICLRQVRSLDADTVRKSLKDNVEAHETEQKFRTFAGIAASEEIFNLLNSGENHEALVKAKNILNSTTEPTDFRVMVGVSLIKAHNGVQKSKGLYLSDPKTIQFRTDTAAEMLTLAKSKECSSRIRLYARCYYRTARLQLNSRILMSLALSEIQQKQMGTTLAGPMTQMQRILVSKMVFKDFMKTHHNLQLLMEKGFKEMVPYVWADWVEASFNFLFAVRQLGQTELAVSCVDLMEGLAELCIQILGTFPDESDKDSILRELGLSYICLTASAEHEVPVQRKESFLDLLRENRPSLFTQKLDQFFTQAAAALTPSTKPRDFIAEQKRYFLNQAIGLGINMEDPNNDDAKMVRIGLEDIDTGKVEKDCQHICVTPLGGSILAEMVGLPLIGHKRITCLKHGQFTNGLKLHDTYSIFKGEHPSIEPSGRTCKDCQDRSPHSADWEHTYEWAVQQHEKYIKLMESQRKIRHA